MADNNNAYGNIKGNLLLASKLVNAQITNILDFRILEGRHSGNGFS
jgi:formiminoglutamase